MQANEAAAAQDDCQVGLNVCAAGCSGPRAAHLL
jgi:hypothetical protein